MLEDALSLTPKVVTVPVRTRVQVVPSLALLVHLGVGGTYSFERNQSRT